MKSSERIQRYLDGEMTEEELWSFQQDLKDDPELKEKLDLHHLVEKSLKEKSEKEFRDKLENSYYKSRPDSTKTPSVEKPSLKLVYFFISFAAALIVGLLIFINGTVPDKDSLFEEYYTPINVMYGTRSAEASPAESNLISGIKAYHMRDFERSERLIESYLLNETDKKAVANYFLGLAKVELQDFTNAAKCFKNVLNDSANYYQEHSQWYLALVFLKNDQLEEAKQLFTQISLEGTVHSEDSKEILKKISRIK